MNKQKDIEVVGRCPICDREMWKGKHVDKHHLVPKSRGGRETEYMHVICHRKIHSLWSEKELENEFNDPEIIKAHPEMEKFIKWIEKKPPDFYDRNEKHREKKN